MNILHLPGRLTANLPRRIRYIPNSGGIISLPRTGYKFGHHFRVYCGKNVHSDMLVHAVEKEASLPMSAISRSVRMAHSVKKKMLFGAVHTTGIQFVEFARIKL